MAGTPIRLFLIDEHTMVREALKVLLERDSFAQIVGSTTTVHEARLSLKSVACDVLVVDPGAAESAAFFDVERLLDAQPALCVLMLSVQEQPALVQRALHGGVRGYMLKRASADELRSAIRDVSLGHTYIDPRLAGSLLVASPTFSGAALPVQEVSLRARELDLLRLLALGRSNREMASMLGLSVNTVKSHLKLLYRKLGSSNRAGAVSTAIYRGLLEASSSSAAEPR